MNYLIPLDSETGGLDEKKADMLTFYMCVVDEDMKIVDELNLALKPNDGRIPVAEAGALRVNGINLQDHLARPDLVTYAEAKVLILHLLKKYLKKNGRWSNLKVLGQNYQFDLNFIWEYLIPKDEWSALVHHKGKDTMHWAELFISSGWWPSTAASLGPIVDYLGLPKREAHNAKEDTLMCLDVYKAVLDLMKSKKQNSSGQDIIALLEAE